MKYLCLLGGLLDGYEHHKQYLLQQIEEYLGLKVSRTRVVYRYDPYNKANFHLYIDNTPNLLLLLKTSNGSYLAAFTVSEISPNTPARDRGLLMSLTNKKCFPCLEGRHSVSYDDYYIIFGNS